MRRREFITLIGGAATVSPFAARAQQPRMPLIGFLSGVAREEYSITAFRRGLAESGFVVGQNVSIEYRFADGNYDRLPVLATELKSMSVRLIVAVPSAPAVRAAKETTSTIPIVFFIGVNPVKIGLVASYNRPGGNVTGIAMPTNELTAKRIELLGELLPKSLPIAELVNPANPNFVAELSASQEAARALGRDFFAVRASTRSEIASAFETLVQKKAGLVVWQEAYLTTERSLIVSLAERYSIPCIYGPRLFTEIGGLMSYGPDTVEMYRQLATYVAKILNGALPADLPVQQPTEYQLVINLRTAKALGLDIPATMLTRADKLIE